VFDFGADDASGGDGFVGAHTTTNLFTGELYCCFQLTTTTTTTTITHIVVILVSSLIFLD